MDSLERKLKLLNYVCKDIMNEEFFFLILKIEEEKIRLYKPREREKLNYQKEKNYIEHIIKYLKKLNIDMTGINKNNFKEKEVRIYILNSLVTLALIDEYKDLINFDEEEENEEEDPIELNKNSRIKKESREIKEEILTNFFEMEYFNNIENKYYKINETKLNKLLEKMNDVFNRIGIPPISSYYENEWKDTNDKNGVHEENMNLNNINTSSLENKQSCKLHTIISGLELLKEKLKNTEQPLGNNITDPSRRKNVEDHKNNIDMEMFGLNIHVNDKELQDFVNVLRYLFNDVLKKRKADIKNIMNQIQILTYNPIIDVKQGKVGR